MKDNTRIEKLYIEGYEKRNDFRSMSDYINEKYVTDPKEGDKLTQEARDVISEVSAIDMAIGSESTKNKYLLIGSAIGIVGTIIVMKIRKKFKKDEA